MKEIRSYSSPFNFGHKFLESLFDGDVVVQEKVDGSQISFGVIDGQLFVRSRNAMINPDDPGMFGEGVRYLQEYVSLMVEGYTYRGEYLQKPKHNTIKYARIPDNHIIVFDIDCGDQDYMSYEYVAVEARSLGLEAVPQYAVLKERPTIDYLDSLLENESILGGTKIEGVVLKNYSKFDDGDKVLMAKYVSDKFKEVHAGDWRERNPTQNDILAHLIERYSTEARWSKAVQHIGEAGKLTGDVQDIGSLMKEIPQDVKAECEDEIKSMLFKHFWPKIARGITRGVPEWYKRKLIEEVLE